MIKTKLDKLRRKSYRDAYVRAHGTQGLAYQIKSMRLARGLTQAQLAKELHLKSQSAVARLEDPSYGSLSLSTLRKVSEFFDVALVVQFEAFSHFLKNIPASSASRLAPPSFEDEDKNGLIELCDEPPAERIHGGNTYVFNISIAPSSEFTNLPEKIPYTPSASDWLSIKLIKSAPQLAAYFGAPELSMSEKNAA